METKKNTIVAAGRAFGAWVAHVFKTIRDGQMPEIELAPPRADEERPVTTVVPASRWERLDRAIGTGRERWRNVLTAALVVVALNVTLIVLWTVGEAPEEEPQWTAAPALAQAEPGLAPTLELQPTDEAVTETEKLAADDIEAALAPAPTIPSSLAYGVEEPAPEAAPVVEDPAPAVEGDPLFATNTEPIAEEPAPAVEEEEPAVIEVAEAAPAPAVEEEEVIEDLEVIDVMEVDADDAQKLARKAGCPKGTLPTRVLPGDTLRTIAWRHAGAQARKLVPKIVESNPRLKPERMFPGDLVCVPDVDRVIVEYDEAPYTIRRGDTIGGLAERFGHLSQANVRALTSRARKRDMLFAGQKVRLPMPRYASL